VLKFFAALPIKSRKQDSGLRRSLAGGGGRGSLRFVVASR
jgi:hypothetical protein